MTTEDIVLNLMRQRAKEHIPAVLLTLLSIVQALALELLWSHLAGTTPALAMSVPAVASWLQIAATFIGIVLVWVVYVSNVMRFRWVPTTSDSVYPFFVGLLEFGLVASLGPATLHLWFLCMAAVVALMTWITHVTMSKARRDEDNAQFFAGFERARWKDFMPQALLVGGLVIAGGYTAYSTGSGIVALLALMLTALALCWQFFRTAMFWNSSVA